MRKEKIDVEEIYRKTDRRFQRVQAIARLGSWEFDLSLKNVWLSDEALAIYGFGDGDPKISTDLVRDRALPQYRALLDEVLDRLIKYNEPYEVEYKIQKYDDGSVRSIYSRAELICDDFPESPRVFGVIQDITERKLEEEVLEKNELRFKQASEYSKEWIWEIDIVGDFTYSSHFVKEILGYEPGELINKRHFFDFFDSGKGLHIKPEAKSANKGEESIRNHISRNSHKDGREVIISSSVFPVFDNEGNVTAYRGVSTDVTDTILAEEALLFNNIILSTQKETSIDGILVVDENEKILSFNQRFAEMWGIPPDILVSLNDEPVLKYVTNKVINPEQFLIKIKDLYKLKNEKLRDEIALKDGRFFDRYSAPMLGSDAKYYGRVWYFRDITEHKNTLNALSESEKRYRNIFENVQDLYYETSIGGTILDVSPSIEYLSKGQYRRDELTGRSIHEYYSDAGKRTKLVKALREQGSVNDFEIGLKNRDGSVIPCSITAKLRYDEKGNPFKIVGSMRDISERKRVESELQQSYTFSESLLKTIPFGMDIVGEEGNVLFQSENLKRLLGGKYEGSKCWDMYSDDKKQCENCPLVGGITNGETDSCESRGVFGKRIFEINHTGMMYQGKKAILEIFQDITERKKDEEELIRAKVKAEESDRLKTAFLHNISHEIRTPLNAIVGFSAILSEPDIDLQSRKNYIDVIMQSSNHLLSVITDIVDISNIEANLVKVSHQPFNINSTFHTLEGQFRLKAEEKHLILNFEPALSESYARIITDSTKVMQVLSNLINNAIKFTDKGHVNVGYVLKGNMLEFFVSDTGIGIPSEHFKRIFDRFYQVRNILSRVYEGTGLGLAISKAYVELMGGKIWLTSERGVGTTFFFTIPYERQVSERGIVFDKTSTAGFVFPVKKTILVAEDVDSNFKLIKYFLSGTNSEVLRAVNGKEAVEKTLSGIHIDLILMDIKMPVMDGYTAVKLIRETNKTIPIIAQTAYADERERAIECGCNGFLSKPFDKNGLLNSLRELI